MSKSSKEQIDNDEKRILRELKKNSKESIDKTAKKCGCSRQKVWRIIKRLEKNNVIWGYSAIIDAEKIDLTHYTVLFKRSITPFDDKVKDNVATEMIDDYFPEAQITIEDILYVNGSYDWILTFTAPGIKGVKIFCEKIMRKYSPFIMGYEVLETMVPVRKNSIKNPSIDKKIHSL